MRQTIWEDPPDAERAPRANPKRLRILAFADDLRAHPGKWGIYPQVLGTHMSAVGTASRARVGRWPGGKGFEAVARTVGGEERVYVRFVGEA